MLGKIIGTSLAGITQFVIWIILGGILMTVVSIVFRYRHGTNANTTARNNATSHGKSGIAI